MHMYTCTVYI